MTWPDGKIGPCASCDRIRPLRAFDRAPLCVECAPNRLASSTVATDWGGCSE